VEILEKEQEKVNVPMLISVFSKEKKKGDLKLKSGI